MTSSRTLRTAPIAIVAVAVALVVGDSSRLARGQDPGDFVRAELRLDDLLQSGRYRDARTLVDAFRARVVTAADRERLLSMRVRLVLEQQAWGEALAWAREVDPPVPHTIWYGVGIAAARSGGADGLATGLTLAETAAARLEMDASRAGRRSLIELERLSVRAAIAAAQEEREELALLLSSAIDLAAAAAPLRPPQPIIPIHELAGELWLAVDREGDAKREYLRSLSRDPYRARSLIGLARVSARTGDAALAVDAYRVLLDRWARADSGRSELREALSYLGFMPFPVPPGRR